jgi:hypothetical protein
MTVANPTFRWESVLPYPVEEVFAWHTRQGAFERLNPPWRPVRIVRRPRSLEDGEIVEIALPLIGSFEIPWKLIHKNYRENDQFSDEQVSGPFAEWRHVHRFMSTTPNSCAMRDEIYFRAVSGLSFTNTFVKRELSRLFRHRHAILSNDLTLHARWRDQPRKTILISGSSGFIGSALVAFLSTAGHKVLKLVRHAPRDESERSWNPQLGTLDPTVFEKVDTVIHLGGASIVGKRWSPEYKREIVQSRTESSALLCRVISQLSHKPECVIIASATGLYGDTRDILADESFPAGAGFLADTCAAWESSARDALQGSARLVHVRIGTVLNAAGGALQKMLPSFKLGLGGTLGGGKQYMSWIALEDLLGIFEHAIFSASMHGAYNAVAPESVTNRDFSQTLGQVLRRPALLNVPAGILRLMLGEFADEALLSSSRVAPKRTLESGYVFLYPKLENALRIACGT